MDGRQKVAQGSESPIRIVLAEDSLLLREGLVRLFGEAGFDTVAAYGDADALLAEVAVLEIGRAHV